MLNWFKRKKVPDSAVKERDFYLNSLRRLLDAAHDMSRQPVDDNDAMDQAMRLNNLCAELYEHLPEATPLFSEAN